MTKKILLALFSCLFVFNAICTAATPKPNKEVFLFYKVSDSVIQCQNADEDMLSGAKELEKELVNHYGKRFIVQGIERIPQGILLSVPEYFSKVKANQSPFIIIIDLEGQGQSTTLYQNAFGAQKVGIAPSTNVHLIEVVPYADDNNFYKYDYGIKSYSSGTIAMGRNIFAAQTDPRKNAKNSIRGCFRDACEFNESINKYANPAAYEQEYNRFTGNFKPLTCALEKFNDDANIQIEKFKSWCNADESRKAFLAPLNIFVNNNFKINYINNLIKMGAYKE
ncbi:MAG: hypothetical protein GXX11_04060 [Acholeplasmataceae bacterium]|nr:hypothetical protein [Acholeplasmataceae bacterium]